MRSTAPLLVAVGLATIDAIHASPILAERAVTCDEMMPLMSANLVAAKRFCNVYLQIIPQTTTAWETQTRETSMVTTADYTTETLTLDAQTLTRQARTTTKLSSTITPGTSTVTNTLTSTAYVDAYGSTIAIMKREEPSKAPSMVELAPRAMFTPSYFSGMRKTEIRQACLCLDLPTPQITRQMQTQATATGTVTLQRTMRTTTALPRVYTTSTSTSSMVVEITAPAPLATETAWTTRYIQSCPPDTATTWICPELTGENTGADSNFQTCSVLAQDNFVGYCLYWSDDGSPAASTLSLGDGSGNPDNDMHRPAVYGDDATDDCPRWADWTCAASTGGNTKRSVLEEAAVQHLAKRGFSPAWISVKDHKQRGLRKMPSGIRRGGKLRKNHALSALRKTSA